MDPALIAALAEQGVALALQIYNQVKAAGGNVAPLADLIAQADANFAKSAALADSEIAANS